MLICYENAALRSFLAAKKRGVLCILEAPSLHYQAQAEALGLRSLDGDWIRRRKRAEIEAADFIITGSALAAQSFVEGGAARAKVLTCPLGTQLSPPLTRPRPPASGTRRFIFVGSIRRLKGVDVLLDVFERLGREKAGASLTLVGSIAESDLAVRARMLANVEHVPHLPPPRLFDVMSRHDCLVLPSRLDGFGMVVPEAMSVGLPVIVSERVGAKMIIEQYPEAGWVVPLDEEHLRRRILHIAENPGVLVPAARAAAQAAQAFSWGEYRKRVVALLRHVHAASRGATADGPRFQGAA
jgi:glycosyltransferase involved in cell wall biosynthesis